MPTRVVPSGGARGWLREWLIATHERRRMRGGGRMPSGPLAGEHDELMKDLHHGRPVLISSAELVAAHHQCGLPDDADRFAPGGPDFGKRWILDEHDQLTEWAG
jgi:hypothetical protein